MSTSRGPRRGPPTATQGAAHQAPVAAWCCMSPRTKVTPATCPRSFRVSPLMLFTATHLQAAQDKHYEHRHGILCTPSTTRQEAGNTHRGAHLAFPHMQQPEEKTALHSPHFPVCLVCRLRSLLCEQRCPLSDYMGSWASHLESVIAAHISTIKHASSLSKSAARLAKLPWLHI